MIIYFHQSIEEYEIYRDIVEKYKNVEKYSIEHAIRTIIRNKRNIEKHEYIKVDVDLMTTESRAPELIKIIGNRYIEEEVRIATLYILEHNCRRQE